MLTFNEGGIHCNRDVTGAVEVAQTQATVCQFLRLDADGALSERPRAAA